MKQSQRVRIFAGGFFIGCIIAAAIAMLRNAGTPEPTGFEITSFVRTLEPAPLPELPFEHKPVFSAWTAPDTGENRWLVPDYEGQIWRVSQKGDEIEIVLADRLHVDGNPGIESPALRAGLEHNHFEILNFNPHNTTFIVKINPFEPNSIEENLNVLHSRDPYIIGASTIPYETQETDKGSFN